MDWIYFLIAGIMGKVEIFIAIFRRLNYLKMKIMQESMLEESEIKLLKY